ncbi:hypothetical protein [Kineococcus rhizosphaerae]|uniref:Uncharacterized protein n=1 Tax=Kineococcus rhizosphaerae TaxID=559628 RepID=A0A2T0R8H2_9ACTN|nr:hypothetical protein [Kineococcus rhizosphaerae]PRY17442.1 hypothetical protein CLV37_102405 [Kineococcus rhizosphaerae]
MDQNENQPLDGTVVGFSGATAPGATPVPHTGYAAHAPNWPPAAWVTGVNAVPVVRPRRRWVPFALAGAGLVLLLGGGGAGYAIGHSTTSTATSQLVPGSGQFPGSADGSGPFGGGFPDGTTDQGRGQLPDGTQLGQQDGGTGTGTGTGTSDGTTT